MKKIKLQRNFHSGLCKKEKKAYHENLNLLDITENKNFLKNEARFIEQNGTSPKNIFEKERYNCFQHRGENYHKLEFCEGRALIIRQRWV